MSDDTAIAHDTPESSPDEAAALAAVLAGDNDYDYDYLLAMVGVLSRKIADPATRSRELIPLADRLDAYRRKLARYD